MSNKKKLYPSSARIFCLFSSPLAAKLASSKAAFLRSLVLKNMIAVLLNCLKSSPDIIKEKEGKVNDAWGHIGRCAAFIR